MSSFVAAAETYIRWAERETPAKPRDDARELLGILVALYGAALNLPEGEGPEDDGESTTQAEWSRIYARCGNLPFDVYWEIFEPLTAEVEQPVGASLGDDLADIHRDLKRGLRYYADGNEAAAVWEWQFHFRAHWGHHASAAIHALHAWWAAEYFETPGV